MKFAIITYSLSTAVVQVAKKILDWCISHHHDVYLSSVIRDKLNIDSSDKILFLDCDDDVVGSADILISVGGDGTLLRCARLVVGNQIPVLGINTGRLGFLANVPVELIERALGYTAKGGFETDRRSLLEAKSSDGQKHFALNEFLFSKGAKGSMVSLSAWYDGMFINKYWSDGIIVASPTGSTAYNMSSGGPIVMPTSDVMVLNPINPHTLTTRPLILPSSKTLTIKVDPPGQDVIFSKDGEISDISGTDLSVEIRKSNFSIDLIKLPEQTYFDTLRNKLMWGLDIREKNNSIS